MIRVLALLALASPAAAQSTCATSSDLAATLDRDGYAKAGEGLDPASGYVVTLYLTQHGGWAAVNWHPDGSACVVQTGGEWSALVPRFGQKS